MSKNRLPEPGIGLAESGVIVESKVFCYVIAPGLLALQLNDNLTTTFSASGDSYDQENQTQTYLMFLPLF